MVTFLNGAIFDLDGCLSQNPYDFPDISKEVSDPAFWDTHWNSVPACHSDVIELYHALVIAGWTCPIVTGRPIEYQTSTLLWLREHEIQAVGSTRPSDTLQIPSALYMYPRAAVSGSIGWKYDMIREVMKEDTSWRFLVEDHKPNADRLRGLLPVMLYERRK